MMIALQLLQVSAAPRSTYPISTLGKEVSAYFTYLFHDTHDLGHLSGFERTSKPYNCRKKKTLVLSNFVSSCFLARVSMLSYFLHF